MALNKRIKRVFLENKAQYIGSIVLIILSTYAFTLMNQFALNFERLVSEFQAEYLQEDAAFTTESEIDDLPALESAADALIEEGLTFDVTLVEGQTLRLFSHNNKVNIPAILEGTGLSSSGQLLLGQYFATANDYEIGDQIQILDRTFTVVGFMTRPNFIYPVQSESDLLPQPIFGTAVISQEDFAAFDQAGTFYAVKFNNADQNPLARSIQFRELLSSRGINIIQWTDIEDNRRVSIVRAEVQILNLVSKAVPSAVLLLGTIMVCVVIWRMIKREAPIIGALYALGYKREEIYRHYLLFPLLIAIVGGIIGTIAGTFLVRFMVSFMVTVFIVPLTGIELNPPVLVISPLLPIILLGASGFLVIRKELQHSPVELMRGKEDENKINFLERALKLERFRFATKFTIRQQLRSLSRVAFLLVGVAVATMLLLWAFFLQSSTEFLTEGVAAVYDFEYEYTFPELRYDPLPEGAEPFAAALFLPDANASHDFHVTGIAPDTTMVTLVDESGNRLRTDQVLITKPLADQLNVTDGGTVNIVRKLDGRTFSLKIDRVADNYEGNFIFLPLADFNETFDMPPGSYLGAFSNVELDLPADETYNVVTLAEKIAGIEELLATVAAMIGLLAVIAFGISVIVIYVVTSLLVEENKDIIALMKIFGYRKKEINSLILNSSIIVVVIGYLIGIPLTLSAVGVLIQTMEETVGLTLPPATFSLPYLLIGLVVVMLSYELSKRMCRRKVNAVSMSEALKLGME
jgi:putative ABC transport system permease protein